MKRGRFGTTLGAAALLAASAATRAAAQSGEPVLSSAEYWARKGAVKL
jgi:BioD-like phosphotransacetylase family protein